MPLNYNDMDKINLELGTFDVKLILDTLEKAYSDSLKDRWVNSYWKENGDFEPGKWVKTETKNSKRLKSTMDFIKRQISEK